jgi:hypothetical protein
MITLSADATTVTLPPDLVWEDESWSPVVGSAERSLTGAQIIQLGVALHGRPITLTPPERGGWMARALLHPLITWRDTPGLTMTLVLRGQTWLVRWRHQDAPPLEWSPLRHRITPADTDFVLPTMRLETTA